RCSSTFQPVTRLMAVRPRVSRSSDAAIFATRVGCHRQGWTAVMVLILLVHELTAAANIHASKSGPRWRSANRMISKPARSAAHRTSLARAKAGSTSDGGSGDSAPALDCSISFDPAVTWGTGAERPNCLAGPSAAAG